MENGYLTKEETLFTRDENGELIPQEVVLETLPNKPKVKLIPAGYGQIRKLYSNLTSGITTPEQEFDLVKACCKQPQYEDKDYDSIKTNIITAIFLGILALSFDIPQKELSALSTQKAIEKFGTEDLLLKKK